MTHKIIRFVPSSGIAASQFAFQGRFNIDDGCPLETPRVFDVSFSYIAGEIRELDFKTHWLMAFGETCHVLKKSPRPSLTHCISVRVYAKAVESQQNLKEFIKHDGQGHFHEYSYDVYEILQGTIDISRSAWNWGEIWPGEEINRAILSPSSFQLDFRRNHEHFRVVWLPNKETDQTRFWRMTSCGDSDPLAYVTRKSKAWIENSRNWPVRIFSQNQTQPEVIFRDGPFDTDAPALIYSPGIGIEFDRSSGKTVWTPKSVNVEGETVTFNDIDLFAEESPSGKPSTKITWSPSIFGGDDVRIPQFQHAPTLSGVNSLTLTETSLNEANDNNIFWQYAYRPNPFSGGVLNENYRPAWIGYPLPIKPPMVQGTSPFDRGLTSELDFEVSVGGNSDWRLVLAPLSSLPSDTQGLLSVEFAFDGEVLKKVDLTIEQKHFALKLSTPSIFGFAKRMVDANAVPSVSRLTDSLSKAQLCFRNAYSESNFAERRVKLGISGNSKAEFKMSRRMSTWQHAGGNPLLRFVSPAGRNLLGTVDSEAAIIKPLPDTTSGLVESTISGRFSLAFPSDPVEEDEGDDPSDDRQLLGTFNSDYSQVTAGYAIHALFLWLQRTWNDKATIIENRLFHRNLILEVIEFYRRINAQRKSDNKQAIEWKDEHVVRFCRTYFSSAAEWEDDTTDGKEIDNYLIGAHIDSRPQVTFNEEGAWPIANVTLAGEDTQKLSLDPDTSSKWLAYKLSVLQGDKFPIITLASYHALATVQQPLIGNDSTGSKIYDNAGVMKDYSSVETGDGIRLQRVYLADLKADLKNEYYLLDAHALVTDNNDGKQGHFIRLSCFDLLVKVESINADERVLTPVVDRQAEIGTAGFCAITGDRDELLNPTLYPRVSFYPLIPLDAVEIPLDAVDCKNTLDFAIRPSHIKITKVGHKLTLTGIRFRAYVPSPREVAFLDDTAVPASARRAASAGKLIEVYVSKGKINVTGEALWQISQEYEGNSLFSGSPVSVSASIAFDPQDGIVSWTMSKVRMTVGVFDHVLETAICLPDLVGTYVEVESRGSFTFETIAKNKTDPLLKLTTQKEARPVYQFEAPLNRDSDRLIAIVNTGNDLNPTTTIRTMLRKTKVGWTLSAVADRVFGFLPSGRQNSALSLMLWHDTKFRYRVWEDGAPTQLSNVRLICNDKSADPLQGVMQSSFVFLDGDVQVQQRFISAHLHTAVEAKSRIQLLITSQEVVPGDGSITAQISMGEVESIADSAIVAGTVLLDPVFKEDGSLAELHFTNDVYELHPSTLTSVDRTDVDVVVPSVGESSSCLDLVPLVLDRTCVEQAFFFQWKSPTPPLPNTQLVTTVDFAQGPRNSDIRSRSRMRRVAVTDFDVDEAPTVLEEVSEAVDSCSQFGKEDPAPSVGTVDSKSVISLVSTNGSMFVTRRGATFGRYIHADGQTFAVTCEGEIRSATFCYPGGEELILVATATGLFEWAYGMREPVRAHVPKDLSDFQSVACSSSQSTEYIWSICNDLGGRRLVYWNLKNRLLTKWGYNPRFDHILAASRLSDQPIAFALHESSHFHIRGVYNRKVDNATFLSAITSSNGKDCSFVTNCSKGDHLHYYRKESDKITKGIDVARTPVSIGLIEFKHLTIFGVAYGKSANAYYKSEIIIYSDGRGEVGRFAIAGCDVISLHIINNEVRAYLTCIAGEKHTVTMVRLPVLDRVSVPLNRCTDDDLSYPLQDSNLDAPQTFHLRADGARLMSKVNGVPFERYSDPDLFVPFVKANGALIGPLRKFEDNLQVQRNNLAIRPEKPEESRSPNQLDLKTVTLLGLSPGGDIGVLYNQTLDSARIADEDVNEELREVLRSRAWNGLTLKRTVSMAGAVTFEFLDVGSPRGTNITQTRSLLSGLRANDEITGNQHRTFVLLNSILISDAKFCFQPIPALYPGSVTEDKIYDERTLRYERSSGKLPDQFTRAELVLSQIGAFKAGPTRQTFVSLPDTTLDGPKARRPFQPKSLSVTYGAVKPGEMLSHRCQSIYGRPSISDKAGHGVADSFAVNNEITTLYTPTASVSLRHKAILPKELTPRISDLSATSRKISLDGTELASHRSLRLDWRVMSQSIEIDSKALPLLEPDGSDFITYDGDEGKYDFKGSNRRLFAFLTLINGELKEVPEYSNEMDLVIRKDNGDPTLPFQKADDNVPAIYLVTRIPDIDLIRSVNEMDFSPQFVNGSVLDVAQSVPFSTLFRYARSVDILERSYHVWKAQTTSSGDWWKAGGEISLVWANQDLSSRSRSELIVLCPWSIKESISTIECLELRVLRAGELQTHLVVSNHTDKNTVLRFEMADGEYVIHGSDLLVEQTKDEVHAIFVDKFKLVTETTVAPNDRVQLVTTLSNGVSIAACAIVKNKELENNEY